MWRLRQVELCRSGRAEGSILGARNSRRHTPMTSHDDRRRFRRVDFFTDAVLSDANGRVPCDVHDLSLHGALVAIAAEYSDVSLETPLTLEIPLDAEHQIRMQVQIAHEREGVYGLECENIDVDSITHLRRLVELNLGDSTLLERELPALHA